MSGPRMVCEVCDREGHLETFFGYQIHPACAPTHWLKDLRDLQQLVSMGQRIGKPPW